jgi:hypothetical protein
MQGQTDGYPKTVCIFKKHLLMSSIQTAQPLFGIRKSNSLDHVVTRVNSHSRAIVLYPKQEFTVLLGCSNT